jgi:hypothetical protein
MDEATRERMIQAWREAGIDLSVRVTAPFRLVREGEEADVIALVHDFGCRAGAIVGALDDDRAILAKLTSAAGYFVSLVNPECYSTYTREKFIDTLNDWQYFGPLPIPSWYTGKPWTR